MSNSQVAIDISNLRFYADMARKFEWQTDVIHWGVVEHTLSEIAKRLTHVQTAAAELEHINTIKIAAAGMGKEATAISGARVHLDGFFRVLESKAQLASTPPDQTERWAAEHQPAAPQGETGAQPEYCDDCRRVEVAPFNFYANGRMTIELCPRHRSTPATTDASPAAADASVAPREDWKYHISLALPEGIEDSVVSKIYDIVEAALAAEAAQPLDADPYRGIPRCIGCHKLMSPHCEECQPHPATSARGQSAGRPTTPLLQKIIEICDAGSAQEFGDADERLRAIRGLIIGEAV